MLVGLLLSIERPAQPSAPAPAPSASPPSEARRRPPSSPTRARSPHASLNFADIAARLNPAVVNIDATARGRRARRLIEEGGRRGPDDPFEPGRAATTRPAAAPAPAS